MLNLEPSVQVIGDYKHWLDMLLQGFFSTQINFKHTVNVLFLFSEPGSTLTFFPVDLYIFPLRFSFFLPFHFENEWSHTFKITRLSLSFKLFFVGQNLSFIPLPPSKVSTLQFLISSFTFLCCVYCCIILHHSFLNLHLMDNLIHFPRMFALPIYASLQPSPHSLSKQSTQELLKRCM